jgi:hypothetical protein
MPTKLAVAPHHHDIAHAHLIRDALDHQCVPGPNRRKHAPADRWETARTKCAQDFARKVALHRGGTIRRSAVSLPHETFWLRWQEPSVIVLPQESAEVTKTCSQRKFGFS